MWLYICGCISPLWDVLLLMPRGDQALGKWYSSWPKPPQRVGGTPHMTSPIKRSPSVIAMPPKSWKEQNPYGNAAVLIKDADWW